MVCELLACVLIAEPGTVDSLIRQRLATEEKDTRFASALEKFATVPLSDEGFLERAYPALLGRTATADERAAFLAGASSSPVGSDPRVTLIDQLLSSEEFAEHFVATFLADLFRLGEARPQMAYAACESPEGRKRQEAEKRYRGCEIDSAPYRKWLKEQVMANTPWDELVRLVLTATGAYSENPAVAYLACDVTHGLAAPDPGPIMTAFAGVEVACSRCHDDPKEEVWQRDYYGLASFFSRVNLVRIGTPPTLFSDFRLEENIIRAPGLKLPADYEYDHSKAGEWIRPAVYFGPEVDLSQHANARIAFAHWLTSPEHPRFAVNVVNRLFQYVFGPPLVEPVAALPGHLRDSKSSLLFGLEDLLKKEGFRVRTFLKALYTSDTFLGREAG